MILSAVKIGFRLEDLAYMTPATFNDFADFYAEKLKESAKDAGADTEDDYIDLSAGGNL